ncbi:hypothetical protein Gogos_019346, partial [Gossypium gossypioides]|nr:hypothetical protein [Gossypium gossypioides]
TLIRALKDCPTACTIVALGGLDNRLLVGEYSCCIDWIEDVMRVLDMKVVTDFITTLWNSWNNRNNFVFRGKEDDARSLLPITPANKNWVKPLCDFVKIHFDATVSNNKIGYGAIARDSDGFVLGGGGGFKDVEMSAEWAELFAFKESLKIAFSFNISKVIFGTDYASLVNRVKTRGKDITMMGYRIGEACKYMEILILLL